MDDPYSSQINFYLSQISFFLGISVFQSFSHLYSLRVWIKVLVCLSISLKVAFTANDRKTRDDHGKATAWWWYIGPLPRYIHTTTHHSSISWKGYAVIMTEVSLLGVRNGRVVSVASASSREKSVFWTIDCCFERFRSTIMSTASILFLSLSIAHSTLLRPSKEGAVCAMVRGGLQCEPSQVTCVQLFMYVCKLINQPESRIPILRLICER